MLFLVLFVLHKNTRCISLVCFTRVFFFVLVLWSVSLVFLFVLHLRHSYMYSFCVVLCMFFLRVLRLYSSALCVLSCCVPLVFIFYSFFEYSLCVCLSGVSLVFLLFVLLPFLQRDWPVHRYLVHHRPFLGPKFIKFVQMNNFSHTLSNCHRMPQSRNEGKAGAAKQTSIE